MPRLIPVLLAAALALAGLACGSDADGGAVTGAASSSSAAGAFPVRAGGAGAERHRRVGGRPGDAGRRRSAAAAVCG